MAIPQSTIVTWLGTGLYADLPNATDFDDNLAAGAAARYYAYDTGNDYVLDRNAAAWVVVGQAGGGASALDDLSDVTLGTSLAPDDLLKFNGSVFVPVSPAELALLIGSGGGFSPITKTSNYTVLAGDSGTDFNNSGASGDVVLSLPPAVPPLTVAGSIHAAHYIKFLADGTDKIAVGPDNSSAGGFVRNNVSYNHIELRCAIAGQWYTASLVGNWGIDL